MYDFTIAYDKDLFMCNSIAEMKFKKQLEMHNVVKCKVEFEILYS